MTSRPTADATPRLDRSAPPEAQRVKVWDPLVRVFHWTLALGCITNLTVLRDAEAPHRYVGYAVATALVVRLLWGVIGTPHARFADFVTTPRRLLGYLKALLRGREPRYIGHNPAGAVMMLALMGLGATCAATGWMMGLDAFWGDRRVEAIHEVAANLILVMAVVHVLAALVESWRHRENLVGAMITGLKRAPSGDDVDHAALTHRG
ncbi:cytochrome b/b6 domain-containing protein [Caulobacter sp. SSI4214]|uniref:cytochrome b/b6 domain-containing protein n=1 Tax=Caulobacter sp. SSI4214 TaxID=2575739 RepID=UPI00143A33E5|nr:cytochrome b/b6 domain-containing protein [Caulobacter sp. SSI4214]